MPVDHPDFHDLVCFNFYQGWRHVQAIYRQAFPDGVTPPRAYLLCACDPDGAVPVSVLGEALQLDGPGVSGLLRRMEGEGLLARSPSPADRREVLVRLTDAGRRLRRDCVQALQDADATLREHIPPRHVKALSAVVDRLGDLTGTPHDPTDDG